MKDARGKKNLWFSVTIASFIIFGFQNCGQNMTPYGSTSNLASTTTGVVSLLPCIAAGCPQDPTYVQLSITNNNPISFLATGSAVSEPAVDVAGYCSAGGYPGTHLYYSIQDLAGNIVIPTTPTNGICNALGKFQFSVNISMLNGSTNYEINVILRAVDSTGVEFDNSLGLNKRQVGLSPTTGI